MRPPDEKTKELHQRAIVIDTHSDILCTLADGLTRFGQRFQLPDPDPWTAPPHILSRDLGTGRFSFSPHTEYFGSAGLYSLPQMVEGGLTVQVCAIYLDYWQLDRALQRGLEMVWWLHREVQDNPGLELVLKAEDIRRIKQEGKCGVALSLEGLDALGCEVRFLDLYYQLGLRMASLTHNRRNLFADGPQGTVKTGGLTALGRQAVKRMNELGILVDLSHTNEAAFWEILELADAPVVVSHLSPYTFYISRGESIDDQDRSARDFWAPKNKKRLQAIAQNGGVVGTIFYAQPDLTSVLDCIEALAEIMGPEHVGLGSDFYGREFSPSGLEDISRLPAITQGLLERGCSDEMILGILGGNFLRVFGQVWK